MHADPNMSMIKIFINELPCQKHSLLGKGIGLYAILKNDHW